MVSTLRATQREEPRSASRLPAGARSHPSPTKWWISTSGARWPCRSMRPLRCSSRVGVKGISTWTMRWQWRCRSIPSLAASVASRMRTGDRSAGCAWNSRLDALAGVRVHAAVQQRKALAAKPAGGEEVRQPVLGVAVLGEDDDPLVGPLLAVRVDRRTGGLQPGEQPQRLGVGSALWLQPPRPAASAAAPAPHRRGRPVASRSDERILRRLVSSRSSSTSSSRRSNACSSTPAPLAAAAWAASRATDRRWTSSVCANAAGDENRRFLSSMRDELG